MFFKATPKNKWGHVTVAWTGSNADYVTIVEQNAGSGNGDGQGSNAIKITKTSYVNGSRGDVAGWFTYFK